MDTTKEGELITKAMAAGTLDSLYIECFLDNPSNKTAALRKAAELAGIEADCSRQRAGEIHNRLQHQIDKGLIKRMVDGATLGYSVTYSLAADENVNPAIRLKAAENLIMYAGKSKPATIPAERDRSDIQADIEQIKSRIETLTGIKI
jgi:hypothetical protein